ncbi:PrsW family intramembrane metalloprotease [Patescibacteria group bacterium]
MDFGIIFIILAGGLLPPLLWLWFWLKEDSENPEPRRLIILTFLAGMLVVALALPLEKLIQYILEEAGLLLIGDGFVLLFFWAFAEEISKYIAARKTALKNKECDEPIDPIIYMITAALGFAALENIIFLDGIIGDYGITTGLLTGNLRFAGANLIHIISSATVGASISFCFFHKSKYKRNVFWGLMLATLLHTFFNYFIIKTDGKNLIQVFFPLWLLAIVLVLIFSKVKKIKNKKNIEPVKPNDKY